MRNSLKGVVSRVNRIATKTRHGSRAAVIYAERRRILEEGRRQSAAGEVVPITDDAVRTRMQKLWAWRAAQQ